MPGPRPVEPIQPDPSVDPGPSDEPVDADSRCPVCREPLAPGSRRCKSCSSQSTWTATCESCGTPVPPDATVCHKCGRYPKSGRACAHCGRPIAPGVRACEHCRALQWAGGLLFLSQSTLGLVVALISGVISLVAIVHSFELFADSDTQLTYASVGGAEEQAEIPPERTITLTATNSGNRPATIGRATLAIRRPGRNVSFRLDVVAPPPDERLVEAGEPLTVTFGLADWNPADYGIAARTDRAFAKLLCQPKRLSVEVHEHSGERSAEIEKVSDRALQTLLCNAAVVAKNETPNGAFCAKLPACNNGKPGS